MRCLFPLLTMLASFPVWAQVWAPPTSGYRPDAFPYGAALLGKRVVVSPGHGWTYDNGWTFQRGLWKWTNCGACEGIIEDIYNAETAIDYLVPMLRQAGATVYVVREIDRQDAEVIVDDGDPQYEEFGPWQAGASPALGYQNDYRASMAKSGGMAIYHMPVPKDGYYWVSIRYAASNNRCSRTRFMVLRDGIENTFEVDQREDGGRWLYLARLYFVKDGDNSVVVSGPEGEDCYIIADGVRIGGGFDTQLQGGVPANQPRWKMAARWYLPYLGVPDSAFPYVNDVVVRPFYANWQGADIYLSLHANATGGNLPTATGTSTYRYNCKMDYRWEPLDPALCDEPPGSAELQDGVQSRIVMDLRAEWDPAWTDHGNLVANFGELRELKGIPGVLVESAFFDGVETAPGHRYPDNRSLHDPRFRYIVSRAMVRALIEYLVPGTPLPPEPPTGLVVRNIGGKLEASWSAVDGASGYRVYVARNGRVFDAGTSVSETAFVLPSIAPGDVAFVRVTSLNAGGESMASEAIGARLRTDGGRPDILLVNGYDRQDAYVREKENSRDYSVEHGLAIRSAASGAYYFDGAANEAVEEGAVALSDYRFVMWALGRESTEHETFSTLEQMEVTSFVEGGGCLIATGSEIGWDLVEKGNSDDQAFFEGVLGAYYVADDADSYVAEPAAGGAFEGIGKLEIDNGTSGTYDVKYPDVLAPGDGGRVELEWVGGAGAAAVSHEGPGRVMLFGFPFETILGEGMRVACMERMLAFCGPPSEAPVSEGVSPEEVPEQTPEVSPETIPEQTSEPEEVEVEQAEVLADGPAEEIGLEPDAQPETSTVGADVGDKGLANDALEPPDSRSSAEFEARASGGCTGMANGQAWTALTMLLPWRRLKRRK